MRSFLLFLLLVFGIVTTASAGEYRYISADEMRSRMEAKSEVLIVDIQEKQEFGQHHLPGSLATYAYPAKTETELARLNAAVQLYKETGNDVVIVCPRGKGGAKRSYDYMMQLDVPAEKLYILENGMTGWPFMEMVGRN